jgi:hypothetical protein
MITHRKISPRSLLARMAILAEEKRPMPDMARLKRLKQEKLGLKDAIAVTRTILGRIAPDTARAG